MSALKALCRRKPVADALQRVGNSIAIDARDMAARTGDNTPRHIHHRSFHAGWGYTHYDKSIEVFRGSDNGMAATYVMANHHAILLEFGWTPLGGAHQPARHYLTNSLWLNKEVA